MEDARPTPERQPMPPSTDVLVDRGGAPDAQARDLFLHGTAELLRTRFATVKGFAQLLERQLRRPPLDPSHLSDLAGHLDHELATFEIALRQFLKAQELRWQATSLR